MQIPVSGKIEKVALPEGGDGKFQMPSAEHVWLRDGHLEATNLRVAVKVPVTELASDKPGAVSPLLFSIARIAGREMINLSKDAVATIEGVAGINRFKPVQSKETWTFAKLVEKMLHKERPYRVVIDLRQLVLASEGLGTSKLTLEFTGEPQDAIRVLPGSEELNDGREAILMPLASSMAPPKPPTPEEEKKLDAAAEAEAELAEGA